jgi:hypothetical protein
MKRVVERAKLEDEPHLAWQAFVNLISTERYEHLTPTQRKARLILEYGNEVQRGGHGRYFEICGIARLAETIDALEEFGLAGQARLLRRAAYVLANASPGADLELTLDDDLIESMDDTYPRCMPIVPVALAQHLEVHMNEYLVLR